MAIEFAVSSWSLHGQLGQVRYRVMGDDVVLQSGEAEGALPLLALPAALRERGIDRLEICHFHFPRVDNEYLAQLRGKLAEQAITLDNILLDDGNLSQANDAGWQADLAQAKFWLEIAAKMGAAGVRIDCGREPAEARAKARAVESLRILADYGANLGVSVITENFHPTSADAGDLLSILAAVERDIGLCVDFGNAEATADKFATLARLMPRATSIHGKAQYDRGGAIVESDMARCLDLVAAAEFAGPFVLIVGETDREWARIEQLRAYVSDRLHGK